MVVWYGPGRVPCECRKMPQCLMCATARFWFYQLRQVLGTWKQVFRVRQESATTQDGPGWVPMGSHVMLCICRTILRVFRAYFDALARITQNQHFKGAARVGNHPEWSRKGSHGIPWYTVRMPCICRTILRVFRAYFDLFWSKWPKFYIVRVRQGSATTQDGPGRVPMGSHVK